jgi:phosphatidylglycerophosphatase A
LRHLIIIITSWFYSGYFPFASGTAGTIATIPLYLLLVHAHPAVYAIVTVALFFIGIWASNYAAVIHKKKDPKQVVIDETVGFLVTMAFIPFSWKALAIGFVIARVLDIIKPPPARQAEALHGGTGIMMDDLIAGIYGNILMWILVYLKVI